VRALRKDGYIIESVTNRGYRLCGDALIPEEVSEKLGEDIEVFCYNSIDSTNTEAKRLLAQGNNKKMLLLAREQTAGRGRQGKSFYSPKDTGLYMSLVLHPDTLPQNAVSTTTAAAVAVCRALEALTGLDVKIKWVNDIYLGDKKVCGILTEAVSDFETGRVSAVIIGIGLNISTTDFPEDAQNAASLMTDIKRADLAVAITNELLGLVGSSKNFIEYYKAHSLLLGREISVIEGSRRIPATALDIDGDGGLTVKLESGEIKTLRSGEISIRRL
jgi:BirA family biotin operon repressor/biotin-[acetyl-CoA-carboxylase] ligase